jgi:hypothetical protein
MSQEMLNLNTKAIQILEEKGFVHDTCIEVSDGHIDYFSKNLKCDIKDCKVPLKLSVIFTLSKSQDQLFFEFEMNHHETRRNYGKRAEFNNKKINQKEKESEVMSVFEKAIDYVQDNIDKFGDFVDKNKEKEFNNYKWFHLMDETNPLDYYYFLISPKFIEDGVVFKTCEIDDNLLGTEAGLKGEAGYRNVVIRRF